MKAALVLLLVLGSVSHADWYEVTSTPLPSWSYAQPQMPSQYIPQYQPQAQVQVVVNQPAQMQQYVPSDSTATDLAISQDLMNSQLQLQAAQANMARVLGK